MAKGVTQLFNYSSDVVDITWSKSTKQEEAENERNYCYYFYFLDNWVACDSLPCTKALLIGITLHDVGKNVDLSQTPWFLAVLLAFYHKCPSLIGYNTHYLFCDR